MYHDRIVSRGLAVKGGSHVLFMNKRGVGGRHYHWGSYRQPYPQQVWQVSLYLFITCTSACYQKFLAHLHEVVYFPKNWFALETNVSRW